MIIWELFLIKEFFFNRGRKRRIQDHETNVIWRHSYGSGGAHMVVEAKIPFYNLIYN